MPTHCSALNCKSRDTPKCRKTGITFHRLPTDLTKKLEWCRNISRSDIDGNLWVPKSKSYLCSKHFDESLFHTKGARKLLSSGSIPTRFDFTPNGAKRKSNGCVDTEIDTFLIQDKKCRDEKRKLRSCRRFRTHPYSDYDDRDSSSFSEEGDEQTRQIEVDVSNNMILNTLDEIRYLGKMESTIDADDSYTDLTESEIEDSMTELKNYSNDVRSSSEIIKSKKAIPSDFVKVEVNDEENNFEKYVGFKEEFLDVNEKITKEDPFSRNKIKIIHLLELIKKTQQDLKISEIKSLNLNTEIEQFKSTLLRNTDSI